MSIDKKKIKNNYYELHYLYTKAIELEDTYEFINIYKTLWKKNVIILMGNDDIFIYQIFNIFQF